MGAWRSGVFVSFFWLMDVAKTWKMQNNDNENMFWKYAETSAQKTLSIYVDFLLWALPAWTLESLSDDYYVPGSCLAGSCTDAWWRQTKAGLLLPSHQVSAFGVLSDSETIANLSIPGFVLKSQFDKLFFFQLHFLPDRDPSCYHYLGPSCLCRVHQESSTRQPCEAEGLKNFQSNITFLSFFELTASWNQFLHFETLKKLAQRDAAGMKDLMEVCCLWVAISENIRLQLGDSAIARLDEMFVAGSLVLILCDNMMFLPHQIQNGSNVHPFGKNRVRFCLGWPKAICTWVWKFRCTNPTKKLEGVIWARKFPSQ